MRTFNIIMLSITVYLLFVALYGLFFVPGHDDTGTLAYLVGILIGVFTMVILILELIAKPIVVDENHRYITDIKKG